MTELITKQLNVMELLKASNISLDMLSMASSVKLDNAINVMSALFSGNLTTLNETYVFCRFSFNGYNSCHHSMVSQRTILIIITEIRLRRRRRRWWWWWWFFFLELFYTAWTRYRFWRRWSLAITASSSWTPSMAPWTSASQSWMPWEVH